MSNQSIRELSDQEILNMELESLAYLFLLDRSKIQADLFSLADFIRGTHTKKRGNAAMRALCEAFQWLYNNGYIMLNIADLGAGYNGFVTRAGKKWLDEKSSPRKSGT